MEEKVSVWKANLTNGIILGLIGVVFSLLLYFLDQMTNKGLGYLLILVNFVILFFMIKSFRDNYRHGFLTYGQSLGAGVVILLYSTIISVIFTYILYKYIDPGLVAKSIAASEEAMVKRGMTQEQIDMGLTFTKKFMTPEIMAISGLVFGMFFGTIGVLIVSIFTRKEGNPLIDDNIPGNNSL
ncbi:MAG: DUF4199 domain-containing protein [Bacteroidales bacterium]